MLVWVKDHFTLCRSDYHYQHESCAYGWRKGAGHYFTEARTLRATLMDPPPDLESITLADARDLLRKIYELPSTVARGAAPRHAGVHPTMKPTEIIAKQIENSSRPGERVLDPFSGAGTTLCACEQMGRTCYAMELDPKYCDVIVERWEALTGQTAERPAHE